MVLRAIGFLCLVLLLAVISMRLLVEGQMKRVVGVHVMDKANHLVDLFETNNTQMFAFTAERFNPSDHLDLVTMADAIHIKAIHFLGTAGVMVGQLRTALPRPPEQMPSRDPRSDHADHGSDIDGHAQPDHQGASSPPRHMHSQIETNPKIKVLLSNLPPPDMAALRPLIDGKISGLIMIEKLTDHSEKPIHYARVVLPIHSASGGLLGFVGFVMNVSHIYSVYAQGVRAQQGRSFHG